MKKLTVRLLESQLLWLTKRADLYGSSISDCLRHILETSLKSEVKIDSIEVAHTNVIEKKMITYAIFSYQLFESLILNKGQEGEELRNSAHRTSHEIVKKLHLNNDKNKINRVTFFLVDEQLQDLKQMALNLGMTFSKIIRRVVQEAIQLDTKNQQETLGFVQKEGIKYAIMTYSLLEEFVLNYCEDGDEIKNNAQQKALDLLEALYHHS